MAKFFGNIGFTKSVEVRPGYWKPENIVKQYCGDIVNERFQRQSSGNVNDDLNLVNEISIVSDEYAYDNWYAMTYVEYMGAKWKVKSVEVKYPRLILSTGGLYNG